MGIDRKEDILRRPTRRRYLTGAAAIGLLLLTGCAATGAHVRAGEASVGAAATACAPEEGLAFLCGTGAAEEVVAIPGTPWLISSALHLGAPATLHLIDRVTARVKPLTPHVAAEPPSGDCPGPPDFTRWSTDGLAARRDMDGRVQLYAANHGDRQAIEFLTLRRVGNDAVLTWTGCARMPAGTLANAIAIDGDDIIITSFHDPADAQAWQRLARAQPVSSVWQWRAGTGFSRLPFGPLSGANGVAISPDRRQIYVSAWAEGAIAVLDRDTGAVRRIRPGFLPDNLHLTSDGKLLVAGQVTSPAAIAGCGAQCPQPWRVATFDPARETFETIATGAGSVTVNYACGAQVIGDRLWITVRGADRIAWRSSRL